MPQILLFFSNINRDDPFTFFRDFILSLFLISFVYSCIMISHLRSSQAGLFTYIHRRKETAISSFPFHSSPFNFVFFYSLVIIRFVIYALHNLVNEPFSADWISWPHIVSYNHFGGFSYMCMCVCAGAVLLFNAIFSRSNSFVALFRIGGRRNIAYNHCIPIKIFARAYTF